MLKQLYGWALILWLMWAGELRADGVDSLLAVQRLRAGSRSAELFAPLEPASSLGGAEREDYRFLLANLPLSDLATLTAEDLRRNIQLARRTRTLFPWSASVPEELWRSYVLPHRISQEPFTHWRARFLAELEPRLAGLSMSRAALEVNHWCHEQATYRPTDVRDQDPLSTCRAGFGRCEEEMILAIAALRSVGIPARQCYTPYWAHSNDNHAWVELWCEGSWSYLGACEPAPELNQAWFSAPARRAMLVVSQAFGDVPDETEPVLRREGRSTSVNSTSVYGPVKTLKLQVTDARGRPLPGRRVVFHLYNYGGWLPALVQTADREGRVELLCGLGSWLITASDGKRMGSLFVEAETREVRLVLDKPERLSWPETVEYRPPAASQTQDPAAGLLFAEGLARGLTDTAAVRQADQLFQRRLQREDSLREARLWWRGFCPSASAAGRPAPDSLALQSLLSRAEELEHSPTELLGALRSTRGNLESWLAFLSAWPPERVRAQGGVPDSLWRRLATRDLRWRIEVLLACSEKDRVECSLATLLDQECTWPRDPWSGGRREACAEDSLSRALWREHVLPPRVDREPCRPWRGALRDFFRQHPGLRESRHDQALLRWIRRELRRDDERDRLGAPLTPAQVLELGGGGGEDLARFYLACCRVRGLPARTNPLTGALERWEKGAWRETVLFRAPGAPRRVRTGRITLLPADSLSAAGRGLTDWCLLRWEEGRLEALDLAWQEPVTSLDFPLELPAGHYLLCTGRRREDGSAAVQQQWVMLKPGGTVNMELRLTP